MAPNFGIFVSNRCDILSSVLTYAALSFAYCSKSVKRNIKNRIEEYDWGKIVDSVDMTGICDGVHRCDIEKTLQYWRIRCEVEFLVPTSFETFAVWAVGDCTEHGHRKIDCDEGSELGGRVIDVHFRPHLGNPQCNNSNIFRLAKASFPPI